MGAKENPYRLCAATPSPFTTFRFARTPRHARERRGLDVLHLLDNAHSIHHTLPHLSFPPTRPISWSSSSASNQTLAYLARSGWKAASVHTGPTR